MDRSASPDRLTLAAFAGAVIIGGGNFVAVRFSNEDLDPLWGAGIRFAAASLLLFAIVRLRRLPLPRGRAAWGAAIYGLLGFGVSYAFLYYALVGLEAGTSSVILASTPLVTLALAVLHGQERFSLKGIVGGLLAIAGIGILSTSTLGGDLSPRYFIAALLGVVAVAESSVIVKSFPKAHPVTTNAVGMAAGASLLVVASLVGGEDWIVPRTGRTWLVLGWLVVFGSVGLFVLFLYVIGRWTASATVYAVTLMPVVAVTLGALLADEDVTLGLVLGGGLVLLAAYVGAISQRKPVRPADTPEPLVVAPEG
ncbi:MAG: EamA family transporter [Actinobacteria bacterium]|nr:EamA family transporter [Actinomycetota bacterium]